VRAAVEFDDESLGRPDAVAGEALYRMVAARAGDAVGVEEGEEVAFQLLAADVEVLLSEQASEGSGPSSVGVPRDEGIEGGQVGELAVLRLVEGVLEVLGGEDGGEVEEGAGDRGGRDAVADGGLVGLKGRVVRGDARAPALPRRRQFGPGPLAQSPQRSRRAVAQHRAGAGGEDGGHPPAALGQRAMTDRVHPALYLVQQAALEEPRDRILAQPEPKQLRTTYDAVLAQREARGQLTAHVAVK
jgi:hypothetical protein